MSSLLFHPTTSYQLQAAIESLPHAILISGKIGAGKRTIALTLASKVLQTDEPQNQPYFLEVIPEKDSISIAEVRAIKDFLAKKTTGKAVIRRILVVPNAHTMGTEAQNALLKTLEEPPADTMIILTAADITNLKPTIRSRAQHILALPVSLEDSLKHFAPTFPEPEITKAYLLSSGHSALLQALLENQTDHPVVRSIEQAKSILKASKYERLAMVDGLTKQKEQLSDVLSGLQQVVVSGLHQAAAGKNKTQTRQFYAISNQIMQAQEEWAKKVNAKLLLTNLFLAL